MTYHVMYDVTWEELDCKCGSVLLVVINIRTRTGQQPTWPVPITQ